MKIAVDAMGGDFAPKAVVEGAILASSELDANEEIVLIGKEDIIQGLFDEIGSKPSNISMVHAPEVVGMSESPTRALAEKKQSSIATGFYLLKKQQVQAFCGAGNTGAMLVGAVYSIRSPKVNRPAIMSYVPKLSGGHSIMLDVGANTDCKPETLTQFGEIGSAFYQYMFEVPEPRVALINVGEEEEKGNMAAQTAFKLLKEKSQLNFIGNIEGRDLFNDKADVLVCDGYIGNVIIKMAESYYEILRDKKYSDSFFDNFNFESVGGSPVLGVEGNVVIGHGISNGKAIKSMIMLAKKMANTNIQQKIKEAIQA